MNARQLNEESIEKEGIEKTFNSEIFEKYSPSEKLFSEKDLEAYFYNDKAKKVLIVEDDLSQMNVLEELILEINPEAKIDWELGALQAISRVSKESEKGESYDMVISDIELGEESSGVDLFKYCIESEPFIEPLLISSHSKKSLKEKYFTKTEPLEYIQKPINFEAFYRKVAPVLV